MDFYKIKLLCGLVMHPNNAEWDRIYATCNIDLLWVLFHTQAISLDIVSWLIMANL